LHEASDTVVARTKKVN